MSDSSHVAAQGLSATAILGAVLAALRYLKVIGGAKERPSVREWMDTDIRSALTQIKAGVSRLDGLIIEADLPGLRQRIDTLESEMRLSRIQRLEMMSTIEVQARIIERLDHSRHGRKSD